MKIIGVGRNYHDHIWELKNEVPEELIIFLMPDTAVLKDNAPFYYPSFSNNIHYEVELVLRISKEGKNIEEQFADRYYQEIGLGIDFTARDLQDIAKQKGLPWTLAKGFNGSAPVSEFISIQSLPDRNSINFNLSINGISKQHGNSSQMIHSFEKVVSYISRFITLKTGDLIFTGTPAGVGEVKIGDLLEADLENKVQLKFEVK